MRNIAINATLQTYNPSQRYSPFYCSELLKMQSNEYVKALLKEAAKFVKGKLK